MKRVIAIAVLVLFSISTYAQTQITAVKLIRLATLEWPPYFGLLLPYEGLSHRTVAIVGKTAGYRLLSAPYAWSKAIELGQNDPNFDGYYPAYDSEARRKNCHLSQSIGTSDLVIASRKNAPVTWTSVSDLTAYTIGTVEGYVNTPEFDAAVKEKRQPVDVAPSDAVNVIKLKDGKVRGIVIDKNVLAYTLYRTTGGENIVVSPQPLSRLTLHICFKRTPSGLEKRDAFDAALKNADLGKIESDYMSNFSKGLGVR